MIIYNIFRMLLMFGVGYLSIILTGLYSLYEIIKK